LLARQSDQSQLAPQNIKQQFSHASICGNNRVVFNIAANKYRLVVQMQYRVGIALQKLGDGRILMADSLGLDAAAY